jgi:type IV secretory pathway VirB6-like protein
LIALLAIFSLRKKATQKQNKKRNMTVTKVTDFRERTKKKHTKLTLIFLPFGTARNYSWMGKKNVPNIFSYVVVWRMEKKHS